MIRIKTKSFYIAQTIMGACLFGGAILASFMFELPKLAAGIGVAIGTVLLNIGLPGLIMKHCETTQPEMMKQYQIEIQDERSTMIRNKAKAKSGDTIQWFILVIAYIAILVETPQWMFFAIVGVFLLKNLLDLFFNIKYQKEF